MAMQYLEGELRRTGNPRDQALADIVSGVLKVRGEDVPLPQGETQTPEATTDVTRQGSEATDAQEVTNIMPSKLKHAPTPLVPLSRHVCMNAL